MDLRRGETRDVQSDTISTSPLLVCTFLIPQLGHFLATARHSIHRCKCTQYNMRLLMFAVSMKRLFDMVCIYLFFIQQTMFVFWTSTCWSSPSPRGKAAIRAGWSVHVLMFSIIFAAKHAAAIKRPGWFEKREWERNIVILLLLFFSQSHKQPVFINICFTTMKFPVITAFDVRLTIYSFSARHEMPVNKAIVNMSASL